jgi:alpha-ketoglutarate-dependent taurine dioxygenase
MPDRRSIVWLYGVRGTAGSRTSWTNNILSYNDLDDATKEQMSKLKFDFVIAPRDMTENSLDLELGKVSTGLTRSVVHTNIAGKTGLFFPFNQIAKFVGMTEEESKKIIEPMSEYITQEKYCYHHDWQDGDIVISEQWLGVHKRWAFKNIEQRMLHRCEMEFVDQDYQ